jgi:hypothetical protein
LLPQGSRQRHQGRWRSIAADPKLAKDTPPNEATRQAVNKWILESHRFDAVLNFAKVVRDPENPLRIRKDLTGDYVRLNTEGYRLIAESIPLDLFE